MIPTVWRFHPRFIQEPTIIVFRYGLEYGVAAYDAGRVVRYRGLYRIACSYGGDRRTTNEFIEAASSPVRGAEPLYRATVKAGESFDHTFDRLGAKCVLAGVESKVAHGRGGSAC
jgi:hypothetical protein